MIYILQGELYLAKIEYCQETGKKNQNGKAILFRFSRIFCFYAKGAPMLTNLFSAKISTYTSFFSSISPSFQTFLALSLFSRYWFNL